MSLKGLFDLDLRGRDSESSEAREKSGEGGDLHVDDIGAGCWGFKMAVICVIDGTVVATLDPALIIYL